MSDNIRKALEQLDTDNDAHWTADGLPRMDVVEELSGKKGLTRAKVTEAQPGFSRPAAIAAAQAGDNVPDPGATQGGNEPWATNGPQGPQETKTPSDDSQENPPADDTEEQNNPEEEPSGQPASELRQKFEAAKKALLELEEERNNIQRNYDKARQEYDHLLLELEKSEPVETTGNAIQGYLRRQRRLLEERGERMKLIKESGVNLKDLTRGLKAPIDSAMSRKNSRGTQRPSNI